MVMDLSDLKKAEVDPNEPMMRLLKCRRCKTVDEVPGYEGPDGGEGSEEFDHLLKFFTNQHRDKGCVRDDLDLITFPVRFWIIPKIKDGIIKQLQEGAEGLDVFGTNFYATKENFSADAMNCWVREHNQTEDCSDYKSDKKELKPGTAKERMVAGLEKEGRGPKVYLCDFCPVKSLIQKKAYEKKGLYK